MTPFILEENNSKTLEQPVSSEMEKAIVHLEKELVSIRTGKANIGMIDTIKVECYDSIMDLKDIASLAAPDTNLLTIQPWDKGLMADIEKAISNSHLGLTPNIDSDMIRLEIPKMSKERREELAKIVNKKIEDAKIAIRNVRKDAQNIIRDTEKKKTISEDFAKRLNKLLQDITDKFTKVSDDTGNKKISELKSF